MNIIRNTCNVILANEMLNYCYKSSFAWCFGLLLIIVFRVGMLFYDPMHERIIIKFKQLNVPKGQVLRNLLKYIDLIYYQQILFIIKLITK